MAEIKYTDAEKGYYDAVLEERAQEIANAPEGTNVEDLIKGIIENANLNETLQSRFMRDLLRRIKELKAIHSKSPEEVAVVEEFEGACQIIDGKYLPKGFDKDKFRVRVSKPVRAKDLWDVGVLGVMFKRVFGETVDAEKFSEIIEKARIEEEKIETMKRELELIRLERKSAGDLLIMLGEKGFMRALGATVRSAAIDPAKMMLKKRAITRGEKELPLLLKDREKTLAAVEKMRAKYRAIFDLKFKPQLQSIEDRRAIMPPREYRTEIEELRKKVKEYGEKRGFHMETFFDEELGINPETPVVTPETNTEKLRKRSLVGKFWREITGKGLPDSDLSKLIASLNSPQYHGIYDMIIGNKAEDIVSVTKFFFQKEYGLKEGRIATPTPDNLLAILKFVPDYAELDENTRKEVFSKFAGDDYKDHNAIDFDQFFDEILKEVKKEKEKTSAEAAPAEESNQAPTASAEAPAKTPPSEEAAKEQPGEEEAKADEPEATPAKEAVVDKERAKAIQDVTPFWKYVCGENPSDEDALRFSKMVKNRFPYNYKEVLEKPIYTNIVTYFFTGKCNGVSLVHDKSRFSSANPENVFTALLSAKDFIEVESENDIASDIDFVLKTFAEQIGYKERPLSDLNKEVFLEILQLKKMSGNPKPIHVDEYGEAEKAEAMEYAAPFLTDVYGEQPSEKDIFKFLDLVKEKLPDYEKILKLKGHQEDIVKFFLTGKYKDVQLVESDSGRCLKHDPVIAFNALVKANEFMGLATGPDIKFVLRVFSSNPEFNWMNLEFLTTDIFSEILRRKKKHPSTATPTQI